VPQRDSLLPLPALLALLNSRLLDWYFRLGSTNSKVNDYQFKNLPAPKFDLDSPCDDAITRQFEGRVARKDVDGAFELVEPIVSSPPYSTTVVACITTVVKSMMAIELSRGDIARTERSALAPEAQPLQDLLDRMVYRMAGLTDAEANALEDRLRMML
jgi:hypothetical protein